MKLTPLADAQLATMELLWQHQRLTAREMREQLYPNAAKPQHGTVQKLLQRLEDKGYITRDKTISTHFFSPAITRDDYTGGELESLAAKLTSGSLAPLLTHAIETQKLSRDEIAHLRAVLDAHEPAGEKS